MNKVLHVRFLLEDGPDGPKGWPSMCLEKEPGEFLTPGFHQIMTPQEVADVQVALQPLKDALLESLSNETP